MMIHIYVTIPFISDQIPLYKQSIAASLFLNWPARGVIVGWLMKNFDSIFRSTLAIMFYVRNLYAH